MVILALMAVVLMVQPVAAGSMVVYYGRNRAVLINVPEKDELDAMLN